MRLLTVLSYLKIVRLLLLAMLGVLLAESVALGFGGSGDEPTAYPSAALFLKFSRAYF